MKDPVIIAPPAEIEPSPSEDKPLSAINGNSTNDTVNILEAIINIFSTKDPVGFCTISKYRKVLNLSIDHTWLFRFISIPFFILDLIQSFFVVSAIVAILFLIIFSLAKFVGFTDWIDNHQYILSCISLPSN